jgi:hypothetical protein
MNPTSTTKCVTGSDEEGHRDLDLLVHQTRYLRESSTMKYGATNDFIFQTFQISQDASIVIINEIVERRFATAS